MQIAATPHRSPDSRRRAARVPRIRPPEAPSGWPIAIAPPLVFTISGSILQSVDAGERLHRERLVELDRAHVGPADAGAGERAVRGLDRGEAEPLRLQPRTPRARRSGRAGASPIRSAAASEPSSTADAPSLSGDALPAVIVPSVRNDGFSPASFSAVGPGSDALVAARARRPAPGPRGRRRSRRPRRRRPAGATGRRTRPAAPARSPYFSPSSSLASPSETVHSAGIRSLTSRHPSVVDTAVDVAGGERRATASAAPTARGSSTPRRRRPRRRRRRSRSCASRSSPRPGSSRTAG